MSWGYTSSNGPSTWVKDFPVAKGKQQSPIDIVTSSAKYDESVQGSNPLKTNYTPENEIKLLNNGHSIMCQIQQNSVLTGGPLGKGKFRLEQFHLHWGADDSKGSEHTIDGKMYAAELHLVHWNADKYKSFGEAVDKSDGLAVLGIMIQPGSQNVAFNCVSGSCEQLGAEDSTCVVSTSLDPTSLLPGNTSAYWTYAGSLTTPPLFESVRWIVFKEPVEFSKEQLAALRSMTDSDGCKMQDNYRPPCPLEGRQIMASFN